MEQEKRAIMSLEEHECLVQIERDRADTWKYSAIITWCVIGLVYIGWFVTWL